MAGASAKIGPCLGLAALLWAGLPARAQDPRPENPVATAADGMEALRGGGHVLFMRHAPTDTSIPDRFQGVDLKDCSTQRPLSTEGRRQAAQVGKALRKLGVPVGEVRASPYCRTLETAELAFGRAVPDRSLLNTAYLTAGEKAPTVAAFREALSRPVPPGTNRVLVSHSSTLADATGTFPKQEGIMMVFHPDGRGGFRQVATLRPADVELMAGTAR